MDFFTVDTLTNARYYVYFIIHHESREIMQFAVTQNPVKEFVRQQLILFKEEVETRTYMIHDRAGEFIQNYSAYGINGVRTSVKAPNMNSIAERVIGSIRREALDFFFIFFRHQLINILSEYIRYYNARRPHQGINQQSPKGYESQLSGKIKKRAVLNGLFYDYYRDLEVPI